MLPNLDVQRRKALLKPTDASGNQQAGEQDHNGSTGLGVGIPEVVDDEDHHAHARQ